MTCVVFIHGLIGSFADPRTLSLLAPSVVITPDLHGYGASAAVASDAITIDRQVEYVRAQVDEQTPPGTRVDLVGHSVGAVVAASYAHRFPNQVASFVNVEGNFSLADAFWSRQLATQPASEVRRTIELGRSDPARWLRDTGVEPTEERVRATAQSFAYQPPTTVQAMARAVVEFTGHPGYEAMLQDVFAQVAVHLVAGARSRAGWDVPDWALSAATSYTEIPDTGHTVMLESPVVFGQQLNRLLGADATRNGRASAQLPDLAVHQLADDVEVAGVPGVLLQ